MGLTVKREDDFGSLFDKFASLPDDIKKDVDAVNEVDKKEQKEDKA